MNLHNCGNCGQDWVMDGIPMFCPACGFEINMDWEEFVAEIHKLEEGRE